MKDRITLSIVLGLICLILVAVMFAQFKTVEKTDISSIEAMSESELRTSLASWKSKYEETLKKYEETYEKIEEYQKEGLDNVEAMVLLERELEEANLLLGKTDVEGEGVIVTLTDTEEQQIELYDLLQLLNELKNAGAEAISINENRVVISTDVALINGSYIKIDDTRISSPYVIKAIGEPAKLESALMQKELGYIDRIIKAMDKEAFVERQNNIYIKKYTGKMNIKYIEMEENT